MPREKKYCADGPGSWGQVVPDPQFDAVRVGQMADPRRYPPTPEDNCRIGGSGTGRQKKSHTRFAGGRVGVSRSVLQDVLRDFIHTPKRHRLGRQHGPAIRLSQLRPLKIQRADSHGRLRRIDLRWLDCRLGVLGVVDAGQFLEGIIEDPALPGTAVEEQLGVDTGSQKQDPPAPTLAPVPGAGRRPVPSGLAS